MKDSTIIIIMLLLVTLLLILEPGPQERSQPNVKVGLFYYAWYNGTPNNYHWNGTSNWSVEDEPTLGYHNSCDPTAVYNQLYQMHSIGINFLIVSWWGIGSFEDQAAQVLYSVVNRSFPEIKLVIMVEGFNESGTYDFNYTKSYIYNTFYSVYPNKALYLPDKTQPLLCWWNAPNMTGPNENPAWTNIQAIHDDALFTNRILGQSYNYVDWYAWTPCSVNSSWTPCLNSLDGGVVTIEPRYDGSHIPNQGPTAVFDQNYTEGLYDRQWSFVLNNHDRISYVLIYSWNEYHERTQIEPCFQDCISNSHYLSDKTAQYIKEMRNIPAPSDLNRDGFVDSSDANILSNAFCSKAGDPSWNVAADLNNDGTVNILDAIILGNNYQPKTPVGVFLYLWYGNSSSMTGGLGSPGWNSTSFPGGGSVVDEPEAGYYVSDSEKTFQRQISEMQRAGIAFAVVSWWGPFTQNETGAINNATLHLFKYLKTTNSDFKIAIMVEPFPNPDCDLSNVTAQVYDYVNDNFVAPYSPWYFRWQGKPLLLFFNPFYPQNIDQRFTVRKIGNRPNPVDWIFWDAPQEYFDSQGGTGVNATNDIGEPYISSDGEVTIVPRIDSYYDYVFNNQTGGYLRFDPDLSKRLYRYEWTSVISNKRQVRLVLIYSFNEYHERSEIEPHHDATASIRPSCLLRMTKLYISELN